VGATRGIVVVSCSDGVLSYPLETQFVDRSLFAHEYDKAEMPPKERKVDSMAPWPIHDKALMEEICLLPGFEEAMRWEKSPAPPASLRLRGTDPHENLVACVTPGRSSKSKQEKALAAAQAAGCVHACILTHSLTRWKAVLLA